MYPITDNICLPVVTLCHLLYTDHKNHLQQEVLQLVSLVSLQKYVLFIHLAQTKIPSQQKRTHLHTQFLHIEEFRNVIFMVGCFFKIDDKNAITR